MKVVKSKPFKAIVNFGLEYEYSQQPIKKEVVLDSIVNFQKQLINDESIYLSCLVSDSLIVLNNQREKHLKLEFINYPKFKIDENILKSKVESLVLFLMKEYKQNRVVIEYLDETTMIEFSDDVDDRVNLNT